MVVTVRNEARNIVPLLDSLVVQEPPLEIIIVDSYSEDDTRDIVRTYEEKYDFLHLYLRGGSRGAGRNFGISKASGEAIAFTDGDCIVSPFWLHWLRASLSSGNKVVAGKTIQLGYRPFEDLERVELIYGGYDITHPACNLAYDREFIERLGGFDDWFLTAEDIDLNLRAVRAGTNIEYEQNAIVYHRTRGSYHDFLKQAFWNGAGRKQLTLKHGQLWSSYRPLEMLRGRMTLWALLRLSMALLGYGGYKAFGGKHDSGNKALSP